jgi:hypothetical protein
VELFVLLIAGVALLAVYYAVTAVATWWDGFGNRHTTLLRAALLIAVVVALLVFVVPESATLGPVIDIAIGAVVALVLLGIVVLTVAVWRRPRRHQAAAPLASPRSQRPLVERPSSGRNSDATPPAPRSQRPLVERLSSGRNSQATTPRSRRPPARRGGSRWKSVYNAAGREQFLYAMGAFDKRTGECRTIKIGITTALDLRLAQVQEEQVGWTETVRYLGWGPGGERRETTMHGRLNDWRYEASEWFEASPELLAEIAKLERLTDEGQRLIEAIKRSA